MSGLIPLNPQILATFEQKAQADGLYAVAYSILVLSSELRELQQNLTFGDTSAGGSRIQGVLEKLAMGTGDIAEALRRED